MTFLFAGVALDIAQILGFILIFLYYLGGINPSGWMTSLSTFLALFRIESLGLRLISKKRRVVGLSLFFILVGSLITMLPIGVIFIFFDQRLVFFWALGIDFLDLGG